MIQNEWINEYGFDLIGYALVVSGLVLIIKGLFFTEWNGLLQQLLMMIN